MINLLSISSHHFTRFRDIAWLLSKYGFSDLVRQSGIDKTFDDESAPDPETTTPDDFARDLEKLGPTYIKVGQFLSTRPDLITPPFLESLSRLQDSIEPAPIEAIQEVIVSEFGMRPERLFREFAAEPLASASLGQVHRAVLHSGVEVVVKVQRPGVRKQVAEDLDALTDFAEFADEHTQWGKKYEFARQLETLRKSLLQELDYTIEANNTKRLAENLADYERLRVPQTFEQFCTSKVLTFEYIEGKKVSEVQEAELTRIDSKQLAIGLFDAYLQQVLVDGFFHADPHPGNLLLTSDGRLAMLDVGMAGRVDPDDQQFLVQLLIAVSEGRGANAAEVVIRMGAERDDFNREKLIEQAAEIVRDNRGASVSEVRFGSILFEIQRIAAENGLRLPLVFTLLGKSMLNLDKTIENLYPEMDVYGAMRDESTKIMQKRTAKSLTTGQVYSSLIEAGEMFTKFPDRVNKIMDLVASNKLSVNVDAVDEKALIQGIQKIANRIFTGLLLAALIIGAAIIMHVESSWTIGGYPIIAITFFLIAGIGAVYMIVKTLMSDY